MAKSYMLVRHDVADFSKWKFVYDAHLKAREEAGLKELHLFQALENPNHVSLLFEVQDIERAKSFVSSDDSRDKMKEAHVEGAPEIYFLR